MSSQSLRSRALSGFALGLGLLVTAAIAIWADSSATQFFRMQAASISLKQAPTFQAVGTRELSEHDRILAEGAWNYIAASTRHETGLVDAVWGYPSTTLWDQSSYLLSLVAAHRLEIIKREDFERRATKALKSIKNLPLFDGMLPNKVYNTQTLEMTDYGNATTPDGIGWSALDVGRMLMALKVIEQHSDTHARDARQIVANWDLKALTSAGELVGTSRQGNSTVFHQEGRLGYEQYAARALALWGLDVSVAMSSMRVVDWYQVGSVKTPIDLRRSTLFGGITPIASEAFILQGLELGFDSEGAQLASSVFDAQLSRFEDTGIDTIVSEDHLDRSPHFAYATVFSNGQPWAVVDEDGEFYPELRTTSFKATVGWDALYDTEYTNRLRAEMTRRLYDQQKGWAAGVYEVDGTVNSVWTLNTNAIILEAIHYIAFGPLFQ